MKRVCCICGAPLEKWGNNPWGALDENGNYIQWKKEDECCTNCNNMYVVPGRLKKYLSK